MPAQDAPLIDRRGADNRITIRSDRYTACLLAIQGPGAAAEVAAALLDDGIWPRSRGLAAD